MATVKMVKSRCVECGARLDVDIDRDRVKCEYCGAVARVAVKNRDKKQDVMRVPESVMWVSSYQTSYVKWMIIVFTVLPILISIIAYVISYQVRTDAATGTSGSTGTALREQKTVPQIPSQHGVHASQVQKWKKDLKEGIPEIFANGKGRKDSAKDELIEELYKQIGKLQVELDWIKKSTDYFG